MCLDECSDLHRKERKLVQRADMCAAVTPKLKSCVTCCFSPLQVNIKHAQKFLYVAEIDGSLLMKIGKAKYEPDSQQWKVLESGKNWGI